MTPLARITIATALMCSPIAAHAQTMSPADYVKEAEASDLYERRSSQLMLGSSTDPAVRAYAQRMIRDHARSTAQIRAAAARAGLHPPHARMVSLQADDFHKLQLVKGSARAKLYLQEQSASHQQALALHQGYAAHGTSAPLKAAAAQIVPVVQAHMAMLPKGGGI